MSQIKMLAFRMDAEFVEKWVEFCRAKRVKQNHAARDAMLLWMAMGADDREAFVQGIADVEGSNMS